MRNFKLWLLGGIPAVLLKGEKQRKWLQICRNIAATELLLVAGAILGVEIYREVTR